MVKKIEHYPKLVDPQALEKYPASRAPRTTKLPSNDSALFPFRFVDVHLEGSAFGTEINFSRCPGEVC
jgi:hypothetical protein